MSESIPPPPRIAVRVTIILLLLVIAGLGYAWVFARRGEAAQPRDRGAETIRAYSAEEGRMVETNRVVKSDEEWRQELTPEQYRILRQKGTEPAFTGTYWDNHDAGVYRCAGCGQAVFSSEHKFESGTGWPSYWQPVHDANVATEADNSWFMRRTEVHCSRCGGHLGHVFKDGPDPTGLRYCINSGSLEFDPETR